LFRNNIAWCAITTETLNIFNKRLLFFRNYTLLLCGVQPRRQLKHKRFAQCRNCNCLPLFIDEWFALLLKNYYCVLCNHDSNYAYVNKQFALFGIITARGLLLTSGLPYCLGIITVQCATTTAIILKYKQAICPILELILPAPYY
jgi:hypothetical protein